MQLRWFCIPAALLSIVLTSCQNTGGGGSTASPGAVTGPFDSRGNYVEAWADNPSKWRKGGSTEIVEAEPDRPAADVPVLPPPVLAANETPKPITTTKVVYRKPNTSGSGSTMVLNTKTKPRTTTVSTTSKTKSKPVVAKAKTPPKKTAVAKAKTKPKTTRHTVRSGDNLNSIAKRYGTSVSAVQKANGLKGSVIRPGQALTIPK